MYCHPARITGCKEMTFDRQHPTNPLDMIKFKDEYRVKAMEPRPPKSGNLLEMLNLSAKVDQEQPKKRTAA
jgi:hypothetical protein